MGVMDQDNVGVPVFAQFNCRPGSHGNNVNPDFFLFLELRQKKIEKSAVFGAGGGGEFDAIRGLSGQGHYHPKENNDTRRHKGGRTK
jgi:hypothetical protein